MMHSRTFCLLLLLFGPLASAQDPPGSHQDNRTGELSEISRILDEVEMEIDRRQALLQAGSRIHANYFRDLVRDYRQAVNDITFARQQNLLAKLSSLQRTERRLALRLWQLDRLRPLMSEVDEEYHSLTRVMRDLKVNYSKRVKDDLIAGRFLHLLAKVAEVEHERLQRRLLSERFFYDVRMWDDLLAEQDRQQENQIADMLLGPMDRLRIPIQRLTRLKWKEGRLAVDRSHWEDLFLPESLSSIALEVATELEVRGWKLSSQGYRSFLPENVFHGREPGVVLLFQNLRYAATEQGKVKIRSTNLHDDKGGEFSTEELRGKFANIDGRYLFSLEELEGAKRQLLVTDHSGEFKLTLRNFGIDNLELIQDQVRAVVRVKTESESLAREGVTIADIYAQNTDWFEKEILSQLQCVGVLIPETRFDPLVIERVTTKLRVADPVVVQGLKQLLEQIDSDHFKTRTKATQRLESNLPSYGPLLADLRGNHSLSLEA
ncbi:MAG: hypothetical protein VYA84_03645, partial [Planctomycetota bacterium]|nr:hypothetical protein [Planctomycetota bacterium]